MDDNYVFRLKEFYVLETFQVAYYHAQVESATNEYYAKAFEKMVKVEQGHVDYFANKINLANEKIPSITGSFFQLAGIFVGETVEVTGQHNTCKLGVALENKAVEMYQAFINECKDKQHVTITDSLMDYLLDEEFHAVWLTDYMNKHQN